MNSLQERHFKEREPGETVAFIRGILDELGIPVEEKCLQKSSVDTWSMRVTIAGTDIGANGKGVSEEYCRASAYAEFMERLQNQLLTINTIHVWNETDCWLFPDEQFLSAEEAVRQESAAADRYFAAHGLADAAPEEREAHIKRYAMYEYYNTLLYWTEKQRRGRGAHTALPFYSVSKREVQLIPQAYYFLDMGSNGMAAGNTPEEALVQGLSEVAERYAEKKILTEKPGLPDVPDEYIRRWPYVWERMEMLRRNPRYRVMMKDCSFGGKYPVAALIVIDQNTGSYSFKPGCHPDFGIAMERALTETTQGGDVDVSTRRSTLTFCDIPGDDRNNLSNLFSISAGVFPFEILGKPSWEFTPVREAAGCSNRQLLKYMLDLFLDEGYDVLIRDVSYTGFNSFHILVPGVSEIYQHDNLALKAVNTRTFLTPCWLDARRFDERSVKLALGCLDYFGGDYMMRRMLCQTTFSIDFDYPGEELGLGWLYAAAMCCCRLERYGEAGERMSHLARAAREMKAERAGFYLLVQYYFQARDRGMDHADTIAYLCQFFDSALCAQADEIFCDPKKVMEKQYPCIDSRREDGTLGIPEGDNARCQVHIENLCHYMTEHPIDQARVAEYLV